MGSRMLNQGNSFEAFCSPQDLSVGGGSFELGPVPFAAGEVVKPLARNSNLSETQSGRLCWEMGSG